MNVPRQLADCPVSAADLERAATALGLEVERRQIAYRDIPRFIKQNRTVLFESPWGWIPGADYRKLFAQEEKDLAEALAPALAALSLSAAETQRALAALIADHLSKRAATAYRVRPVVTAPWRRLARGPLGPQHRRRAMAVDGGAASRRSANSRPPQCVVS